MSQVRLLIERAGGTAGAIESGSGVGILDVCSGKGLTAMLLSRLLPEARVVMLDVARDMDLSHVAARPNLQFVELDLFSAEAAASLHAALEGATVGIAIGVHLCGALSPRLVALAAGLERINAFALSPCCLKGNLGQLVKRNARQLGRSNYELLVEALAEMCAVALTAPTDQDEKVRAHASRGEEGPAASCWERGRWQRVASSRGEIFLSVDEQMLSPRNAFVSVVKQPATRGRGAGHAPGAPEQDAAVTRGR